MARRRDQAAGGEVFEGEWVVLKGGMKIGLGWMARVARFREEGEIGQAQAGNQFRRLGAPC